MTNQNEKKLLKAMSFEIGLTAAPLKPMVSAIAALEVILLNHTITRKP